MVEDRGRFRGDSGDAQEAERTAPGADPPIPERSGAGAHELMEAARDTRFGGEAHHVAADAPVKLEVRDLCLRYGSKVALRDVGFQVREKEIFGIIGPANSGKTSLLRALNRMNEMVPGMHVDGQVLFSGEDVNSFANVYALRRRIGVVFPLPVGLPLSIYDNVALSPRLTGVRRKEALDDIVERCLRRAALWDEVKDRLHALGSLLSGGQQQRLTIARALSQDPELLLLDEFSIAVDPVTTMRIEDVLKELRGEMTIIMVTNLVQQARRLAQRTAFFLNGEMVEVGNTEDFFTGTVQDPRTREYVEGKFG
jgi:phosphate transport system ATP-binding protein